MKLNVSKLEDALNRRGFEEFQFTPKPAEIEQLSHSQAFKDWRSFRLDPTRAITLSQTTIDRLEHNTSRSETSPPSQTELLFANSVTLTDTLEALHQAYAISPSGFRQSNGFSYGGRTGKRSVFPPPAQIPHQLSKIDQLSRSALILERPWGPFLVMLLILRLHPFYDGNGRCARAYLHVELWRRSLISDVGLPLSMVLDANRDLELALHQSVSTAETSESQSEGVAEWIMFFAQIYKKALCYRLVSKQVMPKDSVE